MKKAGSLNYGRRIGRRGGLLRLVRKRASDAGYGDQRVYHLFFGVRG